MCRRDQLLHVILSFLSVLILAAVLVVVARRLETIANLDPCAMRGALGTPAAISADGVTTGIWGWAYDRAGVREIQVITDGKIVGRGRPVDRRADVSAALPGCPVTGATGFAFPVSTGPAPMPRRHYEVRAVTTLGHSYAIGSTVLGFEKPIGSLDPGQPIRWNGENKVTGWAVSPAGPVRVSLLAGGRLVASTRTDKPHWAVARTFSAWPAAEKARFETRLAMRDLPRGRYSLTVRMEGPDGATADLPGPEVWNDDQLGMVVAQADRFAAPAVVDLRAWVGEGDAGSAYVETENGLSLGLAQLARRNLALGDFEKPLAPADKSQASGVMRGVEYVAKVSLESLPPAVHRIGLRTARGFLPGPLVRAGAGYSSTCSGAPRRIYYPGNHRAFRTGFKEMQSWRALVGGGCVEVGIRGRVEYLRTTRGRDADYQFAPDFPEAALTRNGREMLGVPLRQILALALRLRAPILITLDGGVWADSPFSAPDIDIVDMLEEDDRTVQWNQYGKAERDDALKNLAGSIDDPELARMMSVNRFNARYLEYKKRNLQAAVREIVSFREAHPEIDVAVNFDPDHYINPWFFQTQWYDYNPDTLRQFREWLFHRGPYADGGLGARKRFEPRLSLSSAARLAGTNFPDEDAVEPPRGPIDYRDPWLQVWNHFKRHLIGQHYDDLASWAVEAGMPASGIFTSQTFIVSDVAVRIADRATNWTDQAGVSIEGAKPESGHMGVILYGDASRNLGKPRSGLSLMDNMRTIDPAWASVELHPAVIERPDQVPSHEDAYRTLLATFNAGARFVSPMWGSRIADQRLHPGRFRSYDSMEGTPFEYQLAWWLLQLQRQPLGTLFFPFGNDRVASLDGWSTIEGTRAEAMRGSVKLEGDGDIAFVSPAWDGLRVSGRVLLSVSGRWPGRVPRGELVLASGLTVSCLGNGEALHCELPSSNEVLKRVRVRWPRLGDGVAPVVLDGVTLNVGR